MTSRGAGKRGRAALLVAAVLLTGAAETFDRPTRDPALVSTRVRDRQAARAQIAARATDEALAQLVVHDRARTDGEFTAETGGLEGAALIEAFRATAQAALEVSGLSREALAELRALTRAYLETREQLLTALHASVFAADPATRAKALETLDFAAEELVVFLGQYGAEATARLERQAPELLAAEVSARAVPAVAWHQPTIDEETFDPLESPQDRGRRTLRLHLARVTRHEHLARHFLYRRLVATDPRRDPLAANAPMRRGTIRELALRRHREARTEAALLARLTPADAELLEALLDQYERLSGERERARRADDHTSETGARAQQAEGAWAAFEATVGTGIVESLAKEGAYIARERMLHLKYLYREIGPGHDFADGARPAPELVIRGIATDLYQGRSPVRVRLQSPDGATPVACADFRVEEGRLEAPCALERGWFTRAGEWRLRVEAEGDRSARRKVRLDGTESRLELFIDARSPTLRLQTTRILGRAEVTLSALAPPTREELSFELRNGGTTPLGALRATWAATARLETELEGRWFDLEEAPREAERGKTATLAAAGRTPVVLGPFRKTPLTPGRYRLVVPYVAQEPQGSGRARFEATSEPFIIRSPGIDLRLPASASTLACVLPASRAAYAEKAFLDARGAANGVIGLRGREIRRLDLASIPLLFTAREVLLGLAVSQDGNEVAAVGMGVVVRSRDGGATWKEELAPAGVHASAAAFAGRELLVFGDDGTGWRGLAEGGWRALELPVRATWLRASFADEKIGYLIGACTVLLATFDGGETWNVLPSPPRPQGLNIETGIFYIAAADGLHRSDDWGKTFTHLQPGTQEACTRLDVRGWMVLATCRATNGGSGNLWFSIDGRTFQPVPTETRLPLMAAALGKGRTLAAVGPSDLLLRGTPAGVSVAFDSGDAWRAIATAEYRPWVVSRPRRPE